MTFLDDVEIALRGQEESRYVIPDSDEIAEDTKSELVEDNIWMGDRRWGIDKAFVLKRDDEYVMVTYYDTAGDSEGEFDASAQRVIAKEVVKYEWIPVKSRKAAEPLAVNSTWE
jgi:hypothetical protein